MESCQGQQSRAMEQLEKGSEAWRGGGPPMETPEGHRTVPAWKCLQELCLDSSPCCVLGGGTLMPSAESEGLDVL